MQKYNSHPNTVKDICNLLGDEIIEIHGSITTEFNRAEKIDAACSGAVTFCKFSTPDIGEKISNCKASVIFCKNIDDLSTLPNSSTVLITLDPRKSFIKTIAAFFTPPRLKGIHPSAIIHPDAIISENSYIGPHAVIGKCSIESNTEIHANVVLYDGVRVGKNVTINAGTVIGADGFGYERNTDGTMLKFIHLGGVLIEDDVEIGSNTSIDRGTLGDTLIKKGVKIDNQVHIAHNCEINEDSVIIAQSMIGGSVKIGARSWIAPGTVIMNGISIGNDAYCGLGSVVTKSIQDGNTVMGNPARSLPEAKALLSMQKDLIKKFPLDSK